MRNELADKMAALAGTPPLLSVYILASNLTVNTLARPFISVLSFFILPDFYFSQLPVCCAFCYGSISPMQIPNEHKELVLFYIASSFSI